MTPFQIYSLASVALVCLGLYGLVAFPHLLRKLLALNILAGGVFLLLVSVAHRNAVDGVPDPVPHAMVLTGIVVAVSTTGFALALARRIHRERGLTHLVDEEAAE